jgi:integrase
LDVVAYDTGAPAARRHRAGIRIGQRYLLVRRGEHSRLERMEALHLLFQLRNLFLPSNSDSHIREWGKSMANTHLTLVAPTSIVPTVRTPRRRANSEYRAREHLTEAEVERLIDATMSHRDATMILLASRHGLRATELVDLRWDQVDFNRGVLHVRHG